MHVCNCMYCMGIYNCIHILIIRKKLFTINSVTHTYSVNTIHLYHCVNMHIDHGKDYGPICDACDSAVCLCH